MKCTGLTAEQLRARALAPSGLSLLGLVRHVAEVERSWFQVVWNGDGVPAYRPGTVSGPFAGYRSCGRPGCHPRQPLQAALKSLTIKDEDRTGYQRTSFKHWVDADKYGCSTRNEVLLAEALTDPILRLLAPGGSHPARKTVAAIATAGEGQGQDDADVPQTQATPLPTAYQIENHTPQDLPEVHPEAAAPALSPRLPRGHHCGAREAATRWRRAVDGAPQPAPRL